MYYDNWSAQRPRQQMQSCHSCVQTGPASGTLGAATSPITQNYYGGSPYATSPASAFPGMAGYPGAASSYGAFGGAPYFFPTPFPVPFYYPFPYSNHHHSCHHHHWWWW